MEKVGQGSTLSVAFLINDFFYLDFFSDNKIKSTRKDGHLFHLNLGTIKFEPLS